MADATASWHDEQVVTGYLDRVGVLPPRLAGEDVLREILPTAPKRILDLGAGDGRLTALVLDERPSVEEAVLVDSSPPMLDRARARFAGDDRVHVRVGDLSEPILSFGEFDLIVSGFAIHHVDDDAKRARYGEAARMLTPAGCFANLEVVTCASPRLHAEFLARIGRPADDPEDRLADVESQLSWLRDAGLVDVDCLWRWRGFALLAGWAPG
jgi:SAM-dependent methyltransferase